MNNQKGFTLIEIIIVIAIIAILASVVLFTITKYMADSKDTAIKGNLDAISKNATQFYDGNNGSYVGFVTGTDCDASDLQLFLSSREAIVAAGGTVVCPASTANDFCVTSTLSNGSIWCVDSKGFKGVPDADGCTDIKPVCAE